MSTMTSKTSSHPHGKNRGTPVRAGSAPPARGYEKPMPHPASRSHEKSISHAAIHSRGIPPKNPGSSSANRGIATTAAARRRRVPPSLSASSSSSCTDSTEMRSSLASRCSLALSRTESIMVSAAGDVIVCRCRRSSTPYIPAKAGDAVEPWNKQQLPCCDSELLSSIDAPWSPVFQSLTTPRHKAISSSKTTTSEFSTYDWEASRSTKSYILGKGKVPTGSQASMAALHEYEIEDEKGQKRIVKTAQSTSCTDDFKKQIKRESPADEHKEDETDTSSSHSEGGWESTIGDLLLSLPSFDYSHFVDGHNDMVAQQETPNRKPVAASRKLASRRMQQNAAFPTIAESPEEKKETDVKDDVPDVSHSYQMQHQQFFHGVPLFLSSLSQVRVTKVSANPLGAHVLMISEEALLFSYGLNNHGQLGIGFKTDIKNLSRGFHTTPTLITPLLENGGKTIDCAAGVDHSLVVVATEGRRLQKLQTKPGVTYSDHGVDHLYAPDSPCDSTVGTERSRERSVDETFHFSETSVQHHQIYGFGKNTFMKLGLIRPGRTGNPKQEHGDDEVLPRRVALHCTVWRDEGEQDPALPNQGIFGLAASAEHSAALVRRATGDVEVFMWGNASLGALGLPLKMESQEIRGEIARKPSFKERNVVPLPTTVEILSHRQNEDPASPYAERVSLGPYCSFVVMSNGKCKSFGFSAEGMLGHGYNQTHSMVPKDVFFPTDQVSPGSSRILLVSAGAFHAVAVTEDGSAHSWGINSNDRLGLGSIDYTDLADNFPKEKKENLVVIEWVPQKVDIGEMILCQASANKDSDDGTNHKKGPPSNRVALACAGYDCSMIVTEYGQVFSFGKRSGRLGKGEASSNVNTPQPLYGGLHLFHARRSRNASTLTTSRGRKADRPQGIHQRSASVSVIE